MGEDQALGPGRPTRKSGVKPEDELAAQIQAAYERAVELVRKGRDENLKVRLRLNEAEDEVEVLEITHQPPRTVVYRKPPEEAPEEEES